MGQHTGSTTNPPSARHRCIGHEVRGLALSAACLVLAALVTGCNRKADGTGSVTSWDEPSHRPVRFWVERLADKDVATRLDAVEALGYYGSKANAAVPALTQALGDRSNVIRLRALRALGKIGPAACSAVPALVAAARQHSNLAGSAGEAMRRMGNEAVDALCASLRDADPQVRKAAVAILSGMVPRDSEGEPRRAATFDFGSPPSTPAEGLARAEPALRERLADSNDEVRAAAAELLGGLGQDISGCVPFLLTAAAREDSGVYYDAVSALRQLGRADPAVVAALTAALDDTSPRVRAAAASALGGLVPKPAATLPKLVARFSDNDAAVRRAAVEAAGGIDAKACTDELLAALNDTDENVVSVAAYALAKLAPEATSLLPSLAKEIKHGGVHYAIAQFGAAAIPALFDVIRDGDTTARTEATDILESLGAPAVPLLLAAIRDDKDDRIREAAARAFWAPRGLGGDAVLAPLQQALRDSCLRVRVGAAISLSWRRPETAAMVPVLAEGLLAPDPELRKEVAKRLQELGIRGRYARGLVRACNDPDAQVRAAAALALHAVDPRSTHAIPTLAESLTSPDVLTRRQAADALGELATAPAANRGRRAGSVGRNSPSHRCHRRTRRPRSRQGPRQPEHGSTAAGHGGTRLHRGSGCTRPRQSRG